MAWRDLTFALVAFAAIAAFSVWLRREPEKWIALAVAAGATVMMAGKAGHRWLGQIRLLQKTNRILRSEQVIEEVLETRRVAEAGYQKYAAPAVGAREHAGYVYDLDDGTFFYWWADWDHIASEPEFPRQRLQIVWDAQRERILWAQSSGDLLKPERILSRELLHHLPTGSVIPATMETLEADIERFKSATEKSKILVDPIDGIC
jgi:hypothetical protein